MEKNESIERFAEGLAKAADRARQLAKAQGNPGWEGIATGFEQIRTQGMAMYHSKAVSRQKAKEMVDRAHAKLTNGLNG